MGAKIIIILLNLLQSKICLNVSMTDPHCRQNPSQSSVPQSLMISPDLDFPRISWCKISLLFRGIVPEFSCAVSLLTYPCLSVISNFFSIFSLYVGLPTDFFLNNDSPVIANSLLDSFEGLDVVSPAMFVKRGWDSNKLEN